MCGATLHCCLGADHSVHTKCHHTVVQASASPDCLACRSLLSGRQAALLAQQQAAALEAAPGQGSQRSRLHQGGAGGVIHWPLTDAELLALALMNAMRGSSRKRGPQRSSTGNYMSEFAISQIGKS